MYIAYIDFANAFNSIDHEALWSWLTALKVPDVPLLRQVYKGSFFQADTPYGLTAPIFLTRGTKQGDGLSPLLFIMIFNALLNSLRGSGMGYVNAIGQRTAQRAFADDLTLTTSTVAEMNACLQLLAQFCRWTGAQPNHKKSEITAYDFADNAGLETDGILLQGRQLTPLPSSDHFRYLGFRFSLEGSWKGELDHIMSTTKAIGQECKGHPYLTQQAVRAVQMVQESRFRYSASMAQWTDAGLRNLHSRWIANVKKAFTLSPSNAGAPFLLPEDTGG
jgi:hypothetical protein